MNNGTAQDGAADQEQDLRARLIAYCHLSDGAVAQIEETMLSRQVSFAEAAVICSAITQRELHQVWVWAHESDSTSHRGVVETALRRRPQTRIVPLQHAAHVKPGPRLSLIHDPDHSRSESIRGLRTELLMFDKKQHGSPGVVAVMSPGAGEGRSLLAAELAIAFAQIGRRTLLVDSDLRRPGLHTLFETENDWGLMQALAFSEAPRLLGVEGIPQLSLLTAGRHTLNPLELLSDGRFERMLITWKRMFDYIVLDTPPVSQYSDGLAIATLAGRVLILMRAASTTHGDMKELLRRLGSTQAHVLGAVMSHF
jgi:protein-tyrosine kinase